jgi:hypothetical protein
MPNGHFGTEQLGRIGGVEEGGEWSMELSAVDLPPGWHDTERP